MFENVNKDLLAKAMQAKTKEEALAILKEGGMELTEADLKRIAGGEDGDSYHCSDYDCPSFYCFTDWCDQFDCPQYGV